jgi:hypothetical protein
MQTGNAVQRLPALEHVQELGVGPFGSLWLARLVGGLDAGRFVFLRRTPLDHPNSDEVERALSAFRNYRRLSHPSLVKSISVIRTASELVWIEEQIVGVTLAKLRQLVLDTRTPVPVPIAARLALDILQASGGIRRACYEQGLLAPDFQIFPDLVMVANFGEPLLAGIGIADALYRSPTLNQSLELTDVLPPADMPGATGESRDMATAGSILWSLLLIRDAFEGNSLQQCPYQVVHLAPKDATFASRIAQCVPEPIQRIVRHATAPQGRRQFQTAQQMVDALVALPSTMLASGAQFREWLDGAVGEFLADMQRNSGIQELKRNSGAPVRTSKPMAREFPFHGNTLRMWAPGGAPPCPTDDEPTTVHPGTARASARLRNAPVVIPPILQSTQPPAEKSDFDDEATTIQRPVRPSATPDADAHPPSQPVPTRRRDFLVAILGTVLLMVAITTVTHRRYRVSHPITNPGNVPRSALERPLRVQEPIEGTVAHPSTPESTAQSSQPQPEEPPNVDGVSDADASATPPRESKAKRQVPKAPRKVSASKNRGAVDRRWGI